METYRDYFDRKRDELALIASGLGRATCPKPRTIGRRLAAIADPLLNVRRVMRQQLAVLHKMLLDTVRDGPVCRRLMTALGAGEAATYCSLSAG